MKKCRVLGFTLIELMIVIAIIGLLATIAIPKMDYAKRAKVSEALTALNAAKMIVAEAAIMAGRMPTAEAVSVSTTSTYVKSVTYTWVSADRGVITAATAGVGDDSTHIHVSLIGTLADDMVTWVCKTGDSSGNNGLPAQYVSANCR